MNTVYIVKFWLPFPGSEYGGLQIVVAKDDAQCVQLIIDAGIDSYDAEQYPDYKDMIAACVREAKRVPTPAECGFVGQFIT